MINQATGASVYTDFEGLAELRAAAGRQTPESMRETARQFEAIFVQTMLKAMRDASPGDGLFDSDKTDFYRDIHDRQLALEIVNGKGLGIASMLMKSMGASGDEPPELKHTLEHRPVAIAQTQTPAEPPAALINLNVPTVPLIAGLRASGKPLVELAATPADASLKAQAKPLDWRPEDPEKFIRDLWPVARKGAALLGVEPSVLVAQAALETGWGQKMIRHTNGRNSFNLFGIKADSRWEGDRATVSTLEYDQGVARRERAAFRAYESLEESVTDYVEFLRSNPRYQQAIENTHDSSNYLRELKNAGYATDPDYVEKIRSIMDGKYFDRGVEQLAYSEADAVSTGLW